MGSCQNKRGITIKANSSIQNKINKEKEIILNREKYEEDKRFLDMPEWPCKKLI